ncbi:MAG: glycosyltransferase [Candidatus Rokuibacteriota bacterium]
MEPVLELIVSTQPGGGPQHVLALATGLRQRGWRPLVAGPRDGALFDRFRSAGAEIVAAATRRFSPLTLARLTRLARRSGARLVHSHGKGAGVYGRLVARRLGLPAVHTFHGIHHEAYSRPARAAYLALERRLSRWTRVVVNVSRAQEAEGLALGLFARTQSRVIVNGVDGAKLASTALDRWDARVALGLDTAAPVVGCAARFDPVKRLDLLVRACAALPDPAARLVLIGRGPEDRRLRALATNLGVASRIVFAGEIPDAARLFLAFDVYAAPSAKEGMPVAVLEAMALGLPVVASDIPAHREVLGPQSGGLVAESVEALAVTLGRLLADPDGRGLLGSMNRTRARSEFSLHAMLDSVAAVYREATGL